MAFWIVGLVALVAIAAWAMHLLKEESLGRERVEHELHDSGTPTLEYVVPTGEDPVVVLAAVQRAGYTACVDSHGAHQLVLVKCPGGVGPERAKVRSVIESAGVATPKVEVRAHAAVQFRDEV
jgi:hypothetical protein